MTIPAAGRWTTGGCIPGTGQAAFRHTDPDDARVPLVVAVPHAGRHYSDALLAKLRNPSIIPTELEDRLVDRVAVPAALQSGAAVIIADAPRAVIDLNRSPDDIDWSMIEGGAAIPGAPDGSKRARNGLGLIPRRIAGRGELWRSRFSQAELSSKLSEVHTPYHAALNFMLMRIRQKWGAAMLVDVHSMPPLQQTHGTASVGFVVGDRFGASCEPRHSAAMLRQIGEFGATAALNRPYSGGYVLDRHGKPAKGRYAVQLEICRSLYLDKSLAELSPRADTVARQLAQLFATLSEMTLDTDGANEFRHAAE